jgi:predicted ATP-binding protein involved in virulence
MKLTQLRISNFQCFGDEPTVISFEPMTFLLGPNGAGKTAVLQALSRLFVFSAFNARHQADRLPHIIDDIRHQRRRYKRLVD